MVQDICLLLLQAVLVGVAGSWLLCPCICR